MTDQDRLLTDTILRTMVIGLKSIEYGYKSFISIEEKEGK
jgi:uncharacterized protein YsxB (DUF464 family)